MEDEVRRMSNSYKDKYSYPFEKYEYSIQAAQQLADKIDQDLLNQLNMATIPKTKGFK
jgi:hypothetical protein